VRVRACVFVCVRVLMVKQQRIVLGLRLLVLYASNSTVFTVAKPTVIVRVALPISVAEATACDARS
jgi:hypothetical protein